MDIEKYRKRYEAKLAKTAPPQAPERVAAQARGVDKPRSAAARAKLIATAPLADDLAAEVADLLAILRDRGEALTVRLAALKALGALDFQGPRLDPFRPQYNEALREVSTDPEPVLRELVLETLAIQKDPYAQELLVKGLRNPDEALVPEPKAIQFLGYDDHGEFLPLVREVYRRATGPAREEALRVLATDPGSERLFSRLLKDKSEARSVRRISASGLQSLNPDAFERAARKIVADEAEDDDVRATTLAALAHGREARERPVDPKLVETVEQLSASTRSPAMRSSIRRFLESTEK